MIFSLFAATGAVVGNVRIVATTATAAVDYAPDEEPIIIEGERSSYGAGKITSATKTATDVQDIPQALTIVTKAQIDDQQLRSIGDLLTFVPGASPATGESNRDQFTLRGNNSTADLFIDGLRDDVQYFRDFYNVSRVEVLKGPNAMIFGRGGGGEIINRVTKRTGFQPRYAGDLSVDSFGGIPHNARSRSPVGQRRRPSCQCALRGRRQLPPRRRPQALRDQPDARHRHRPRIADRPVLRIFS